MAVRRIEARRNRRTLTRPRGRDLSGLVRNPHSEQMSLVSLVLGILHPPMVIIEDGYEGGNSGISRKGKYEAQRSGSGISIPLLPQRYFGASKCGSWEPMAAACRRIIGYRAARRCAVVREAPVAFTPGLLR
jgi:hypothetical protein